MACNHAAPRRASAVGSERRKARRVHGHGKLVNVRALVGAWMARPVKAKSIMDELRGGARVGQRCDGTSNTLAHNLALWVLDEGRNGLGVVRSV